MSSLPRAQVDPAAEDPSTSAPTAINDVPSGSRNPTSDANFAAMEMPTLEALRATRLRIASNFVNLPTQTLPEPIQEVIHENGLEIRNFRRVAEQNREMGETQPEFMETEAVFGWTPAKPDPRVNNLKAQMRRLQTRTEAAERQHETELEATKAALAEMQGMYRSAEEKLAKAEEEVAALKNDEQSAKGPRRQNASQSQLKTTASPQAKGKSAQAQVPQPSTRFSKRKRGESPEESGLPEKKKAKK